MLVSHQFSPILTLLFKKDLVPLQSKFFPAKFFFCILEIEILAGKNNFAKDWIYFAMDFFLSKTIDNLKGTKICTRKSVLYICLWLYSKWWYFWRGGALSYFIAIWNWSLKKSPRKGRRGTKKIPFTLKSYPKTVQFFFN